MLPSGKRREDVKNLIAGLPVRKRERGNVHGTVRDRSAARPAGRSNLRDFSDFLDDLQRDP